MVEDGSVQYKLGTETKRIPFHYFIHVDSGSPASMSQEECIGQQGHSPLHCKHRTHAKGCESSLRRTSNCTLYVSSLMFVHICKAKGKSIRVAGSEGATSTMGTLT